MTQAHLWLFLHRLDASTLFHPMKNVYLRFAQLFCLCFCLAGGDASAEPIKVFLFGGQSNMVGQTSKNSLTGELSYLNTPRSDVPIFAGADAVLGTVLEDLKPGLVSRPNNFGPELSFGHTIADLYPGAKIALIKYAQGGSFINPTSTAANAWPYPTVADPAIHNNAYSRFQKTVNDGLAALVNAGYEPEIVGMLWHQGESNVRNSTTITPAQLIQDQATYELRLTEFIADVRSLYGANLPFLIGEITIPDDRPGAPAIIAAQQAVASSDPFAVFVPGDDLVTTDRWHFNTASMVTLGERFANGYSENFGSTLRTAYQNWSETNAPTSGGDPDADEDDDGVSNALEFVLGGSRTVNDHSRLPTIQVNDTHMDFSFQRAAQSSVDDSVVLRIVVGDSLTSWPDQYLVPAVETTGPPVAVQKNNPPGFDTVTLSLPRAGASRKFARLEVVVNE